MPNPLLNSQATLWQSIARRCYLVWNVTLQDSWKYLYISKKYMHITISATTTASYHATDSKLICKLSCYRWQYNVLISTVMQVNEEWLELLVMLGRHIFAPTLFQRMMTICHPQSALLNQLQIAAVIFSHRALTLRTLSIKMSLEPSWVNASCCFLEPVPAAFNLESASYYTSPCFLVSRFSWH